MNSVVSIATKYATKLRQRKENNVYFTINS